MGLAPQRRLVQRRGVGGCSHLVASGHRRGDAAAGGVLGSESTAALRCPLRRQSKATKNWEPSNEATAPRRRGPREGRRARTLSDVFPDVLRQYLVDEGLVADTPPFCLLPKPVEHTHIETMATSWRGSSPIGGRPTRRIALSCSGDESGISEKSILREVGRALAAARPARADDADRFAMTTPPQGIDHHAHSLFTRQPKPPKASFDARVLARLNRRDCGIEGIAGARIPRRTRVDIRPTRIPLPAAARVVVEVRG